MPMSKGKDRAVRRWCTFLQSQPANYRSFRYFTKKKFAFNTATHFAEKQNSL